MSSIIRVLGAALLAAAVGSAVAAQPAQKPTKADVPPPPGMNDPGVTTPASSAPPPDAPAAAPDANDEDPLAPLPKPDSRLVRDKASRNNVANEQRMAASEVTRRTQGNDTVEEYREHGRIWMIKIIPVTGPSQTFLTNDGSGRLVRDPKEGPVSPVYYSLYEWK
jgi:hypothetical protein